MSKSNTLKFDGLRSYLIGPIESVSDNEAMEWRTKATEELEILGVKVVDPTRKNITAKMSEVGEERAYMKMLKETGKWYEHHKRMKKIVHYDLRAVDHSDFIISYFPEKIQMVGTIHELVLAASQNKRIFAFTDCPKKYVNSWALWLIGADNIYESLDDLFVYLKTQTKEELMYNWKE